MGIKLALTALEADMVTEHTLGSVPVHAPLQDENTEFTSAAAVRLTVGFPA